MTTTTRTSPIPQVGPPPPLMAPAYTVFRWGQFGPKVNPIGSQVVWTGGSYHGPLEVTAVDFMPHERGPCLVTRTFNREHVFRVPVSAAMVLIRDDCES